MKQPRTPVQAHPTNPASTPPTNNTGHEQPRPACSKTAPAAKLKTDKEPPSAGSVVINVQGATFDLSIPDADVLDRAAYMATKYCNLLTRTPSAPATPVERRATLRRLPVQFSRAEAERIIALTATARFVISEEQPQRDKTHWRNAGTLEAVMEDHHARHRENGPNEERATRRYLTGDPWFDSGRQIITEGGQIDTPPDFVRTRRTAPFRHMQTRLLPVYYKAVAEMHDKQKVLLFRLSDLTPDKLKNIHCANEYHWRPEPGKVAGRPLLDCSNAPPGSIPLKSAYTRLRGIERYQQVSLGITIPIKPCVRPML